MSHNPNRITCKCGRGKVSAWDGRCGHCRTKREREIHQRLLAGWPRSEAVLGYRTRTDKSDPDDFADLK